MGNRPSEEACPSCGQRQVRRRFTWRGILTAIFCFPCGLWCCLRKKITMQCQQCGLDVVRAVGETTPINRHGYRFKEYEATRLPPGRASHYRNQALSVTSMASTATEASSTSQSPLIREIP